MVENIGPDNNVPDKDNQTELSLQAAGCLLKCIAVPPGIMIGAIFGAEVAINSNVPKPDQLWYSFIGAIGGAYLFYRTTDGFVGNGKSLQ